MTPPPHPKPYWFDTAGLSDEQIAGMDPDYLYFLRHVRLEGDSYEVEIPSRNGVSPPVVVRYEAEPQALPGPNAAAPDADSEQGGRGASSPVMEMVVSSAAAAEVPSGVDIVIEQEEALDGQNAEASKHGDVLLGAPSPVGVGLSSAAAAQVPTGAALLLPDVAQVVAPATSPDDGIGYDQVSAEADETAPPATVPAWYDSVPDIDESYRLFLQRSSEAVNHNTSAFDMGNVSASLEEADQSAGNSEQQEVDGENEEGQKEEEADEENKEEQGGGHEVEQKEGPEEEEDNQEQRQEELVEEVVTEDVTMGEAENKHALDDNGEMKDAAGSLFLQKNAQEAALSENEEQLNVSTIMKTPQPQPLIMEASSSQHHIATPLNALDLDGVIWPTHIVEREESEFKQKLIEALTSKPFCCDEYAKLFAMATKRSPITKERRTRYQDTPYSSKHEMGKSYFDNYPDLADQVKGENSYPKRLALLRGLFFWLENLGHDDQFRPWRDDFKTYRVTFVEDE